MSEMWACVKIGAPQEFRVPFWLPFDLMAGSVTLVILSTAGRAQLIAWSMMQNEQFTLGFRAALLGTGLGIPRQQRECVFVEVAWSASMLPTRDHCYLCIEHDFSRQTAFLCPEVWRPCLSRQLRCKHVGVLCALLQLDHRLFYVPV